MISLHNFSSAHGKQIHTLVIKWAIIKYHFNLNIVEQKRSLSAVEAMEAEKLYKVVDQHSCFVKVENWTCMYKYGF